LAKFQPSSFKIRAATGCDTRTDARTDARTHGRTDGHPFFGDRIVALRGRKPLRGYKNATDLILAPKDAPTLNCGGSQNNISLNSLWFWRKRLKIRCASVRACVRARLQKSSALNNRDNSKIPTLVGQKRDRSDDKRKKLGIFNLYYS
jgi:hypothetical protein